MDDSPKDPGSLGYRIHIELRKEIKMKSIAHLFLGTASFLMLGVSSASASNGMQFVEFPFQETVYHGDCIQEHVFSDDWVSFKTHEFTTPSGVFHSVIGLDFVSVMTGLVTGNTWFGEYHAAANALIGPGETSRTIVKGVATPVTGDGPKFLWTWHFQITATPNGDLVVSREMDEENAVKCIGKQ
jgi:hypothetical protein